MSDLQSLNIADYPQVPTYLWTEYDVLKGEDKRSGKFKSEDIFLIIIKSFSHNRILFLFPRRLHA